MANVFREAFPGGLTDLVIILGIQAFAFAFDFSTQSLSTLSALCMAFIGLLVLYQVCKPFDAKRRVLWGCVAASLAFSVLFFRNFFSLSPLGLQELLVLTVFLALSWPVMRGILVCFDRGSRLAARLRPQHRRRMSKKG